MWKTEEIFDRGDPFFSRLEADLDQARKSILLETYIFAADQLGHRMTQKLCNAARRGVRVSVLVDGVGSRFWDLQLGLLLRSAGVETRVYHPIRIWDILSLRFSVLNRRNHRKACLIDDEIAYLGSFNICDDHLESVRGAGTWRDTGIRVTGEALSELRDAFESAWYKRSPTPRPHNHHLMLNHRRFERGRNQKRILRQVRLARRRIWITNAYFIPHRALLRALRQASSRGVDVRVMVPKNSDVFFIPWITSMLYSRLLRARVRVFEYLPTMLHAKTLLIDDWGTVGSSNLNYRSLLHDLEVDVIVTHPRNLQILAQHFLLDLGQTSEVTSDYFDHRPFFQKWLARFLFSLKHWM